tara:strand:- start:269 stop:1162 length:894 start_codon:yes stop_codon:yes gene_type:complete
MLYVYRGINMKKFKNIAVISKKDDKNVADTLKSVVSFLEDRKFSYFLDKNSAKLISTNKNNIEDVLPDNCDIVLIIGGDGTLLSAAQTCADQNIPICGINKGRMGFLADIPPDKVNEDLKHILVDGDFSIDSRFSLSGEIIREGKSISKNLAFNDIVIHSRDAIRMIEMDIKVDNENVYTLNADGMIVSTPTGSTAYALSGGGPIIQPNLEALVLVPISPHILSNRPIVINSGSTVEIKLSEKSHTNGTVSFDGQINIPLNTEDVVRIEKSKVVLRLIQPPNHSYFSILRKKLGWGT